MQSIGRRVSILLVACSIAAILLITIFVNLTINNRFNRYMIDIQNKRHERIVGYFQEIYKRDGNWNESSGTELMHEAYMGNYCLTLRDNNKKVIWGMNPEDIRYKSHFNTMLVEEKGVYTSKTFEIKFQNKIVGYVDIGQYSSVLLTEEDVNFKVAINKSIFVSSIVTLIIIISISLYFSKQFSVPIKEVANMSVNLSKGRFDSRSKTKSNIEELENLRISVNILAEKLNHQEMLRRRLVSDISHEIRTPLNILQNNLEAMIDGVFSVNEERLISLNDEVIRFGRLLNNLDVLKEFEAESISLDLENIALDELVESIYRDFTVISESKGLNLKYEIEPTEDYKIRGDRDKLKQVFINLLSNAIKFTEADTDIWIRLYSEKEKVVVEIQDSGIGINENDLDFIFERFYRGDKSRNQIEGNGIGLTIVKNILQLHSATIQVDSKEGKGTIFKICFNKT